MNGYVIPSDSSDTLAIVRALMKYDAPLTYQQMFNNFDSSQVVLVTGEEDNVFQPRGHANGGSFVALRKNGDVGRGEGDQYVTAVASVGDYLIKLAAASASGDADLYVRVGAAPTTESYDCRPYRTGSDEECRITLDAPAKIYVDVNGFADEKSSYVVTVDPLN